MLITEGPDFMQLKFSIKIRIMHYEVSEYLMKLKMITQSYKLILSFLNYSEIFFFLCAGSYHNRLLMFANRIKKWN